MSHAKGGRWIGLLGLTVLVSACAGQAPTGSSGLDAAPFAHLVSCGDAPYIGTFTGTTSEGLLHEKPGSTPSSDVYGIRPDGSVARITTDLGTYNSGITADGVTIFASPYPAQAVTGDEVVAIESGTGERAVILEAPIILEVAPSPDGSLLAITTPIQVTPAYAAFRVGLVDPDEPNEIRRWPGFDAEAREASYALKWSPDGRRIAYLVLDSEGKGEIRVLDPLSGEEHAVPRLTGADGGLTSVDWSTDGSYLLVGETLPTEVVEVDLTTGTSSVVLEGVLGAVRYSAADRSRITVLEYGTAAAPDSAVARTWTRAPGGTFVLTSSATIGADVQLVAGAGLDLARCALS